MQLSDEDMATLKGLLETQLNKTLSNTQLAEAALAIVRYVLVSEITRNKFKGE